MTHPNEMAVWSEIACQRGCEHHPTRTVHVSLGGQTRYRDLTPIPARFATEFDLDIWDTDLTPLDGGPYCPARDAVSETILSHGVWEPQETTVLLLCWETLDNGGLFLDIGSQIGWFSTLAAVHGVDVVAFEADPVVAALCEENIGRYGTPTVINTRVSASSDALPALPTGSTPATAKIDIEGAEEHAIEMLWRLIADRSLKYILMEMSPVFNDTYPAIAEDLIESGYRMYGLPPKQMPPVVIDRLADLIPYEVTGDVATEVASWHQRDVLFVMGGIEP